MNIFYFIVELYIIFMHKYSLCKTFYDCKRKFQEKKRIKLIKYFTKYKFLREILLKSGIGFDQGRIQGGHSPP